MQLSSIFAAVARVTRSVQYIAGSVNNALYWKAEDFKFLAIEQAHAELDKKIDKSMDKLIDAGMAVLAAELALDKAESDYADTTQQVWDQRAEVQVKFGDI